MEATIIFKKRDQAQEFVTAWAFKSLSGYSLGDGQENVKVNIYNVSEDLKSWVDIYAKQLNKGE